MSGEYPELGELVELGELGELGELAELAELGELAELALFSTRTRYSESIIVKYTVITSRIIPIPTLKYALGFPHDFIV